MQSLNEDLKTGIFKPVYLLYGEEAYLRKLYKNRLKNAMVPEGDTINFAEFEGKDVDVRQIIDLAETMPFFSDHRMILIENSGFFKNATPELADYVKTLPDTVYIVFVESEVDKRSKLFKAVKDKGRPVELGVQDENTLLKWILGNVKREGKQISERTLRYLLERVGTDMENLEKELEKLFCYTLERTVIENSDIDEVCTVQITNQIFAMVDAVAEKQQKKSLKLYYDLLALKEPPMRILFLLARQFRILLQVKKMTKAGYGKKEIAESVGIPPFAVGKYQSQANRFKLSELNRILEASADTEEAVKTGRIGDAMGVELFLVEYSA